MFQMGCSFWVIFSRKEVEKYIIHVSRLKFKDMGFPVSKALSVTDHCHRTSVCVSSSPDSANVDK